MTSSSSPVPETPTPPPQAKKSSLFDENFFRFFRFGAIDNSLLIVSLCVGFSLDAVIARRVGAHGYGVLIGASVGNMLSDGLAALPEGKTASIGALCGSTLPLIPAAIAMMLRRPMDTKTKTAVAAASMFMLVSGFAIGKYFDPENENETPASGQADKREEV